MYFVIEIQIITGFDHICRIQNTEKSKYNEQRYENLCFLYIVYIHIKWQ